MTWTKRGTGSLSFTTRSTPYTLALPASIAANDVIKLVMSQEINTAVVVTVSGYTAGTAGENATSNPDMQYLSFYKVAAGGETTASITHAANASIYCSWSCLVLTPSVAGAPSLDVQSAAIQTGNAGTLALTAISPTVADTAVFAGEVNWQEDNSTAITSPYTKEIEVVGAAGGGNAIAWNNQAASGTTGTVTWTIAASANSVGALHAFKPAAGAATKAPPPARRPWRIWNRLVA